MTVTGHMHRVEPVRRERPFRRSPLDPHSGAFRRFSDVLLAGVFVFVVAIPVVTAFAGLASASSVLLQVRHDEGGVRVRALFTELGRRLRTRFVSHLIVPVGVLATLFVDALVLPRMLGGTTAALVMIGVLFTASMTAGLVYAITEHPESSAAQNRQLAVAAATAAPGAVALLAFGVLVAAVICVIAPLLSFIMGGALAFATAAAGVRLREEKPA